MSRAPKFIQQSVPKEDILPEDQYMAAALIQFVKYSGIPENRALKIFDVAVVKASIKESMTKRYLPGIAAKILYNRFIGGR
jgi:hypothetical protein